MADDIVERLRYEAWHNPSEGDTADAHYLAADALAEIERLRAALDSLLADIDGDHQPEWASDEAEAAGKNPWCCAWCGAADGGWPCVHRKALDELKEARREQ